MKRLGLIVNRQKSRAGDAARRVGLVAAELGIEICGDPATLALTGYGTPCAVSAFAGRVEAVVAIGGDGTMLDAARQLQGSGLPLMGLNIGSLGYLTTAGETRLEDALRALRDDRFQISRRTALASRCLRADGRIEILSDALNDVVVSRGASVRVTEIELTLDGVPVTTYVCDGVIVATPTGSTAYSLSAGGPIVMPSASAFVISVICPHALGSRPLIVGDETVVTLAVLRPAQNTPLIASADGQDDLFLQMGDRVEIRRSPRDVGVIQLLDHDGYAVLNRKLGWGGLRPHSETGPRDGR